MSLYGLYHYAYAVRFIETEEMVQSFLKEDDRLKDEDPYRYGLLQAAIWRDVRGKDEWKK